MINPIPIFYKSARMWMVRTISRIILSGVFAVEFRDFFLTDLLCSMVSWCCDKKMKKKLKPFPPSTRLIFSYHWSSWSVHQSYRLKIWTMAVPRQHRTMLHLRHLSLRIGGLLNAFADGEILVTLILILQTRSSTFFRFVSSGFLMLPG